MSMLEALQNHIEGSSPYELELEKQRFIGSVPTIPTGWVSIEEHLPMFLVGDIMQGYSEYIVKYKDGIESVSRVSDHNTWYYHAKEQGITHWFNKK